MDCRLSPAACCSRRTISVSFSSRASIYPRPSSPVHESRLTRKRSGVSYQLPDAPPPPLAPPPHPPNPPPPPPPPPRDPRPTPPTPPPPPPNPPPPHLLPPPPQPLLPPPPLMRKGRIHQPPLMPPPRRPEVFETAAPTIRKRIKTINTMAQNPIGELRVRGVFATRRIGGWPERVTLWSSATYFASCHAAISTAEP